MSQPAPTQLVPVILCGGAGTRLWPESRGHFPKQFMSLDRQRSIFRATVERVMRPDTGKPIIVTNEALRFLVLDTLEAAGIDADIVLEPVGRDTAPAIAAAALIAEARGVPANLAIFASDHVITGQGAFDLSVNRALAAASAGFIAVFGIAGTTPSTAYGYIAAGADVASLDGTRQVTAFIEKPDAATAEKLIAEGRLWNSGMFVGRSDVLAGELAAFAPELLAKVREAVDGANRDGAFIRLDDAAFRAAPKTPFDIAVMEKTRRAVVVEAGFDWSDVGAWDAVWAVSPHDDNGNATLGDVMLRDTRGSIVRSQKTLTVVVGMDDVAVIATADAILVAPKSRSQEVKTIVAQLEREGRAQAADHARVMRPWGTYETTDLGDRYRVKRITVKPGGQLSLQKHFHRSEHWIVVKGTAQVTNGEEVQLIHENQSIYIPVGNWHRLENPGKLPLELIEVQVGGYLEEDDIVRKDDKYGRS